MVYVEIIDDQIIATCQCRRHGHDRRARVQVPLRHFDDIYMILYEVTRTLLLDFNPRLFHQLP